MTNVLLLTKLRDIAFNERTRKKPPTADRPVTAMATSSKGQVRTGGCHNKTHNPLVKSHTKENCWAIYPEKKKAFTQQHNTTTAAPSSSSQHQVPAFAAIATAHCLVTSRTTVTTVLDSGASHHMFNSLVFSVDTTSRLIPISTGCNSSDLSAICTGTALVAQSDGQPLELRNSLFVPGLSRNLLSLSQLVKKTASITQSTSLHHI
jgi:hypothetical protein